MWYLLGDVGGTNLRLAAMDQTGRITARLRRETQSGALPEACAALVREIGAAPRAVALAAAGVIEPDGVRFTNAETRVTRAALAAACDVAGDDVHLLNDFEAAAWALADITAEQVSYFQGGPDPQAGPRVIIGPGTGLGVGALLWQNGTPHAVPGEGGHIRLTPQNAEDLARFEALIALWPEVQMGDGLAVEAEAVLSGTGLPLWYRAIAQTRNAPAPLLGPEAIFAAARAQSDATAIQAVASFARYLGGLAGDLGLVFGARGGVFMTGGVAQANPWIFDDSFLDAFNAGGRHSDWRRALPVGLFCDPDFGLTGAGNWLRARMD